MKDDEYIDFLVNRGLTVNNTRMPYAEILMPNGKILYVSNEKPINPAMSTDFYQLSTCAAYLESDREKDLGTFNSLYRVNPFSGSYAIFLGLSEVIEFLNNFQYTGKDIDFLRSTYNLPEILWEYLRELKFTGTVEAIEEGSMAQPHIPLIQVTANIPLSHIIETQLLTLTSYPTMVCTKSARVTSQCSDPWLEFGLRGAPCIEAGLIASRSAYIGGSSGTSNVLAHQIYGIPASGTMNHAFIESWKTQLDGFLSYGRIFKEKSIFLIDTYGYKRGIEDAIKAANILDLKTFKGTRDDGEHLAEHSKYIRKYLDDNDFKHVKICISNELDEYKRKKIRDMGGKIDADGVGRSIVTMPDSGMVYKLVEATIYGEKIYTIKVSDCEEKITDPGRKKVIRGIDKNGNYSGDVILLSDNDFTSFEYRSRDKKSRKYIKKGKSLLKTVIKNGSTIDYKKPSVDELKHFVSQELKRMPPEMLKLDNCEKYFVGLDPKLHVLKNEMIVKNIP